MARFKAGVERKLGFGLNPDRTGLADTLTLKYKKPSDSDFTDPGVSFTELYAGYYETALTLPDEGKYLIKLESTDESIHNEEIYVDVDTADINDVKTVVDNVLAKVSNIETQVDLLDEAELNNIKEQVEKVQSTLENLKDIVSDVTATVTVSGDLSTVLEKGDILSGETSKALGTVLSSVYDSENDVTSIVMENVKGVFQNNEKLLDDLDNEVGTISGDPVFGGGAVDSVMEFVKYLNEQLEDGATGLDAITKIEKDIVHIIKGDDKLEDGSDCPTAGKGLGHIYDALESDFNALTSQIDTAKTNITDAITSAKNDLTTAIDNVQTVVDANKDLLENSDYGLAKIKEAIDGISSDSDSGIQDIKDLLTDSTNGLAAIRTAVMDKLDLIEGKIDTIQTTLDNSTVGRIVL